MNLLLKNSILSMLNSRTLIKGVQLWQRNSALYLLKKLTG